MILPNKSRAGSYRPSPMSDRPTPSSAGRPSFATSGSEHSMPEAGGNRPYLVPTLNHTLNLNPILASPVEPEKIAIKSKITIKNEEETL